MTVRQSDREEPSGRTVGSLRRWAGACLSRHGVEEVATSVDWILGEVLGCQRSMLIANPDRTVSAEQLQRFRDMIARRSSGEPVQYVIGWTEFYGLRFTVSNVVLVPRPETELLVEVGLELIEGYSRPTILDVGTGSGCIGIAIGSVRADAVLTAVDVSEDALEVAKENARAHKLSVDFQLADLRSGHVVNQGDTFDLVISNPPYIHPSESKTLPTVVAEFEPHVALFTGDDPLEPYRLLLRLARRVLRLGGSIAVEVHEDRALEVSYLFCGQGFLDVRIRVDIAGKRRVVHGAWSG